MSYYAAGGYYSAGGFSWKKLRRAVHKATSFVTNTPILSGLVGLVPGASTLLGGMQVVDSMASHASAPSAVAHSNHGTPGHQAYHGSRRRPRRTRRRRTRARAWA